MIRSNKGSKIRWGSNFVKTTFFKLIPYILISVLLVLVLCACGSNSKEADSTFEDGLENASVSDTSGTNNDTSNTDTAGNKTSGDKTAGEKSSGSTKEVLQKNVTETTKVNISASDSTQKLSDNKQKQSTDSKKNVSDNKSSVSQPTITTKNENKAEEKKVPASDSKKGSFTASGGYNAVCNYGYDFLAVGTGGKISRIGRDKTVVDLPSGTNADLNGITSANNIVVAVGNNGTILVSKDGNSFKRKNSGVNKNLYAVTVFRNIFFAAGEGGIILCSSDGEEWISLQTKTNNNIISISANNQMCMAVTRESQILMSLDGETWKMLDYNKYYEGYDEPYWFHSINACGNVFFLAGEHKNYPGLPIIMSSDTGEIWMPHGLNRVNGEPLDSSLPISINVIGLSGDQLIAGCDDGKLLTITECVKCNKLEQFTKYDIKGMAFSGGVVALVGEGFWFDVQESTALRQYKISPEQAKTEMEKGAYIIDVRSPSEYEELHVKGSINIPVDQIKDKLTSVVNNYSSKIIFYCALGVRSQTALEQALALGYENVYNLGGIDDWPYEKVSGSE